MEINKDLIFSISILFGYFFLLLPIVIFKDKGIIFFILIVLKFFCDFYILINCGKNSENNKELLETSNSEKEYWKSKYKKLKNGN